MRNYNYNRAFSLLETIIALAVLSIAVIGPFQLAIKAISASVFSQNQITAFYLAQEAMEFVKNRRDTNLIQGKNWLDGLEVCQGENGCYIDVLNNSISVCNMECPPIKLNQDGFYNYQTGDNTIFTRKIVITTPVGGNNEEANVKVIVNWKDKFMKREVLIEENIFRW